MTTLNFEESDFIDPTQAWAGVDSNTDEVPWGGISTIKTTDLGALRPMDSLSKWPGIQKPIPHLTHNITAAIAHELDSSLNSEGIPKLDNSPAPEGTLMN